MRLGHLALAAGLLAALGAAEAAQPPPDPAATGARIDRASFAYRRRIAAGAPGVAWMRLDLAALAHSRLADVRLVSASGFQVPYLVEDDQVPLRITLPTLTAVEGDEAARLGASARGHRSVYALTLPLAPMPPCRLVLETPSRIFERTVHLLARHDGRSGREPSGWQTTATESWEHSDPESAAPPLVLSLPTLDSTEARLAVDEGDNQPLPLERPVLEVRTWRLRFVRATGDELWLVYGRPDVGPPRYDLALLATALRQAPANEVAAEPESAAPEPNAGRKSRLVFWGTLVTAVVVLLALLARLLRNPGEGNN